MRQKRGSLARAAVAAWGFAAGLPAAAASDASPRLRVPVACEVGRTCFVQYYVDRDPSPGSRDFRCGTLSYDGHNGTDIRVPTLAEQRRGVDVVAAADGRVLRVRDGVPDVSVRAQGRERVEGAECGNGVVVAHDHGLETQYCHLARGSVAVRPGETVRAGQTIGRIGLSGATEYPHLHFVVRQDGAVVDPFAPEEGGSCGAGAPLWDEAAAHALAYAPGAVLNAGFAPGPVTMEAIESGEALRAAPDSTAPALVAFVRAIGLRAGDVQRLVLTGPDGATLAENRAPPLESNKAQWMMFGGVRRPAGGWRPGVYRARYALERGGSTALEHAFEIELKP
ncbi:MAG TPA: M23 family metallopeptidase [Microvirga sp.]|nr:M23 family metallopeptidase [Microvirga sp.]